MMPDRFPRETGKTIVTRSGGSVWLGYGRKSVEEIRQEWLSWLDQYDTYVEFVEAIETTKDEGRIA